MICIGVSGTSTSEVSLVIFKETKFKEVFEIEPEVRADDRGYFYRNFAAEIFHTNGITDSVVHINRGFNTTKGTIRGFHYQAAPKSEDKILQALNGSFYDIVVDLRSDSPTYKKWQGFELSAERKNMLIVPKGYAHGIQTLTDNCELQYFVTEYYSPDHERGIRYNDTQFGFVWPLGEPTVISEKDSSWPDFKD